MQDPLALLSDDGESSGADEPCPAVADLADTALPAPKRARGEGAGGDAPGGSGARDCHDERGDSRPVGLEDLQLAGYRPAELLETDSYLREAETQQLRCSGRQMGGGGAPIAASSAPPAEPPAGDAPREESLSSGAASVSVRSATGGEAPAPWDSLVAGALPPELSEPLVAEGIEVPTPIQAHACPILAAGRDLIGVSETGSGKTLAYVLPCLAALLRPGVKTKWTLPGSPLILVLAPTRELAAQIEREMDRFRNRVGIRIASIYGGTPSAPQLAGLRAGPEIVVATPGRLNDILENNQASCNVRGVRFLVLDEADRMLDLGFEEQVRRVVEAAVHPNRQTILFSATWPERVRLLSADFLRDPVLIRVGAIAGGGGGLRANADITQDVMILGDASEKPEALAGILTGRPKAKTLVFVARKKACHDLTRFMRGRVPGLCDAIHGDRLQHEREAALAGFREGPVRILFATDVAGRGLDVRGVTLVVNYDPPRSPEDYVHRIGRTGRGGQKGLAISMLTWQDLEAAADIASVMRRSGSRVPPNLHELLGSGAGPPSTALERRRVAVAECRAKAMERMTRMEALSELRDSTWNALKPESRR